MSDNAYGGLGPAGFTDSTEGPIYTVTGGDWEDVLGALGAEERITLNMGPQHPSTHGVLRMVLELEGETVKRVRPVVGYLHTGIEKNCEYRTWVQGTTFVTRMDYLSPLFNETAYCLAVEKLLGITEQVPERATVIRVIMMELCRISSHCVAFATNALEVGALSMMLYGFRERELVLDIFELVTGLRMNHAYVRPGGVAQDLPPGAIGEIVEFCEIMPKRLQEYEDLLLGNPIWQKRNQGVGYLDAAGCIALGVTGPMMRATGLPWDVRKIEPYCGYETYDFDIPTSLDSDCWGRFGVRLDEVRESVKIIQQAAGQARARPGHGRRQEDCLAVAVGAGRRRDGQQPRSHPYDHGYLDGGPHPSLQARDRGLPGSAGPGLRPGGVSSRRVGVSRDQRLGERIRIVSTSATRRSSTSARYQRSVRVAW